MSHLKNLAFQNIKVSVVSTIIPNSGLECAGCKSQENAAELRHELD